MDYQERKKIIIQITYRLTPVFFVILIGLISINNGVYFAQIPELGNQHILIQLYYIITLFFLSPLDLGMPVSGELFYRILLYVACFSAPVISGAAAIEAILRTIDSDFLKQEYKNHIIIIGASSLTISRVDFLKEIQEKNKKQKIIIVDNDKKNVNLEYLKQLKHTRFIIDDYNNPNLLNKLNINFSKAIWIFTKDDFLNFNIALKIKNNYDIDLDRVEIKCESTTLYTDICMHPETKKIRYQATLISHNRILSNIFYYRFFYQLIDADNLIIYGCNDFVDSLIKTLFLEANNQGELFPINNMKIMIIDNRKEVIELKKERQKLHLEWFGDAESKNIKKYQIVYEYKEINNDTTHEEIAKKIPLLERTKYLILTDNFEFNRTLALGISTSLRHQKPFRTLIRYGNPMDKLIYRCDGNDFDNMIGINSANIKGGSYYYSDDQSLIDRLCQNNEKTDTFRDIYCFNEQYEMKNIEKTKKQIIHSDECEFKLMRRRDNVKYVGNIERINKKLKQKTRFLDSTKLIDLKKEYEAIIESSEAKLINKETKKSLIKLFKDIK